jgi:hypothetical protein
MRRLDSDRTEWSSQCFRLLGLDQIDKDTTVRLTVLRASGAVLCAYLDYCRRVKVRHPS